MIRQRGISLLEVLLAITVIASIIVISVRYFNVADRSSKVSQAMAQIKTISDASYEWLQAERQPDFSATSGQAITLTTLINAGLLTNNIAHDPWGGTITIAPGNNPAYVKITMTELPIKACRSMARKLQTVSHSNPPSCGSTYHGEF